MSLKKTSIEPVPAMTVRIATASFPKGNPYLRLREQLGTIFSDDDFADLFPRLGKPALAPWRLALVTLLQFRESLSDRQAAEALRARIDWKYLLGLELEDHGFDFSVLSEFRSRLLAGDASERLLVTLLDRCKAMGLLKARGKQRTDATHVLACVRSMNRLELLAEAMRAALNELAEAAPEWLRGLAPAAWLERYGRRIEDSRLPHTEPQREAYAHAVGEDGFLVLDQLERPGIAAELRELPKVRVLRALWGRHFLRGEVTPEGGPTCQVSLKPLRDLPPASEGIESPYDPEARYRSKRGTSWTGYAAHLTESCDDDSPNLITQVTTTTASVHEANCTASIQQALVDQGLAPSEHYVDAGYVHAEVLVSGREGHGIEIIGPPRGDASWQNRTEGAFGIERFAIDWERKEVRCPEGRTSSYWKEHPEAERGPYVSVGFSAAECRVCPMRARCTRAAKQGRHLKLPARSQFEALRSMRELIESAEGRRLYKRRAGIEGTISQGVRSFGLRRARYRGEAKVHLQHVATAAAMDVSRIADWLGEIPRAKTRKSRFARLVA
ncbi:IS1182 family transposase (plasmid) [Tundrisphaera lichenicola]|uniref:IS1182 family transposase n=1 Tax=Tundrisphaera lichenicola TaxID=2029860 RepID=UPI003EBB6EFC